MKNPYTTIFFSQLALTFSLFFPSEVILPQNIPQLQDFNQNPYRLQYKKEMVDSWELALLEHMVWGGHRGKSDHWRNQSFSSNESLLEFL